jgi:hypothetical protein
LFAPRPGLQYTPPTLALRLATTILPALWPAHRAALLAYLTVPLLVVTGVGLARGLITDTRPTIVLAAWSIGGIVASILISNKPLARYLLPWVAPLAVFAAVGVVSAVRWLAAGNGSPGLRGAAITVLIAGVALPLLRFDTTFALRPEETALPAYDDREFVADWPAGTGLARLAATIATRVGDGAATIAFSPPGTANPTFAVLLDDPGKRRFALVDVTDARADGARFVVEALSPFVPRLPGRIDRTRYRLVDAIERPRTGTTVRLFERIP